MHLLNIDLLIVLIANVVTQTNGTQSGPWPEAADVPCRWILGGYSATAVPIATDKAEEGASGAVETPHHHLSGLFGRNRSGAARMGTVSAAARRAPSNSHAPNLWRCAALHSLWRGGDA